MNLNTRQYLSKLEQPNNPLFAGWSITPVDETGKSQYWRCVHVHRCTKEEADGDHNVWVDIIDENGQRIAHTDSKLYFFWIGSEMQSTIFEKPQWEPGANFMLTAGEDASCFVDGNSDIVHGLLGEYGHASYYVILQRKSAAVVTPPHQPNMISVPMDAILDVEKKARDLQEAIARLR